MATRTMESRTHRHEATHSRSHASPGPYGKFALMIGLSLVAMFILMYAMVDNFASVFNNIDQF